MHDLDGLPDSRCCWIPLPASLAALPAAEARLVADVAERRRSHFAAGRHCARAALAAYGHGNAVIGRSPDGAPQWPEAVVGSIAHCAGAAVAIAAERHHWVALGIDVEIERRLPADAAAYVLDESERRSLAALPEGAGCWSLAAFSAKECVHKCLQPLAGLFLGFDEVAIHFEPAADRYWVEPRSDRAQAAMAPYQWQGRLLRRDGLLFSLLAARRR